MPLPPRHSPAADAAACPRGCAAAGSWCAPSQGGALHLRLGSAPADYFCTCVLTQLDIDPADCPSHGDYADASRELSSMPMWWVEHPDGDAECAAVDCPCGMAALAEVVSLLDDRHAAGAATAHLQAMAEMAEHSAMAWGIVVAQVPWPADDRPGRGRDDAGEDGEFGQGEGDAGLLDGPLCGGCITDPAGHHEELTTHLAAMGAQLASCPRVRLTTG